MVHYIFCFFWVYTITYYSLRLSAYVRKLSKKLSDAADDVEDSKKELHQVEQKVQLIKRNIDQTNESIVINESKIFKV